jgi:AmiR/NasT family two-component response regulator
MQSDDFEDHLAETLVTRPLIEQAKGVLALASCETPQQAFAALRRASQEHDVHVHDLASALVDAAAGRTPGDPQLRKVIWHEWGSDFPNC